MTRFLSAAGLAVYALAVSTAFPSVKDAGESLSLFAPGVAAQPAVASAPAAPDAATLEDERAADAAGKVWHTDRDGMLMDETVSAEPFAVLNAL